MLPSFCVTVVSALDWSPGHQLVADLPAFVLVEDTYHRLDFFAAPPHAAEAGRVEAHSGLSINASQSDPLQIGAFEDRLVEVGALKLGVAKICAGEVGKAEVGVRTVGAAEAGVPERGPPREVRPPGRTLTGRLPRGPSPPWGPALGCAGTLLCRFAALL